MLREALQFLTDLGQKAKQPTILQIPGQDDVVYVAHNNELTHYDVPAEHRDHDVALLESLFSLALKFNGEGAPCFWVSHEKVVLVIDDEIRRDFATFHVLHSEPFKWLAEGGDDEMQHRELIRVLRVLFRGCLDAHPGLLEVIRNMKFRNSSDGLSEIAVGKESMGRSIESAVSFSGAAPPDEIILRVPLSVNMGEEFTATIVCHLDIDTQQAKFSLRPMPGEIDREVGIYLDGIDSRLQEAAGSIPVYFGTP